MNGGAYKERTHQADKVDICLTRKMSSTSKMSLTSSLSFTIFLKPEKKREVYDRAI
jgi:hypothetical protein